MIAVGHNVQVYSKLYTLAHSQSVTKASLAIEFLFFYVDRECLCPFSNHLISIPFAIGRARGREPLPITWESPMTWKFGWDWQSLRCVNRCWFMTKIQRMPQHRPLHRKLNCLSLRQKYLNRKLTLRKISIFCMLLYSNFNDQKTFRIT